MSTQLIVHSVNDIIRLFDADIKILEKKVRKGNGNVKRINALNASLYKNWKHDYFCHLYYCEADLLFSKNEIQFGHPHWKMEYQILELHNILINEELLFQRSVSDGTDYSLDFYKNILSIAKGLKYNHD